MTPCVHCDDTGFSGTDAYGERVRCPACVPTLIVNSNPGPKPAGWDAIADANTKAVGEMMAEKAARTPADGAGGYFGPGCQELFDETRRIAAAHDEQVLADARRQLGPPSPPLAPTADPGDCDDPGSADRPEGT